MRCEEGITWFSKTKPMIYGPLVGRTMCTSPISRLMARHYQANLQTREHKETNVNIALQVPRPACIAKYNHEMGAVDRHNFYRQGVLRLHMAWRTKTWQTRIQLEILALTLVDSFLACKQLLPQWHHDEREDESFFGNLFVLWWHN